MLKPGTGKLALIWNYEPEPDKNSIWQREIAELCWAYDLHLPQFRRMNWRDVFESPAAAELFEVPLQSETMYWSYKIRPEDMYQLWLTKSYITDLPEQEKKIIKSRIDTILKEKATPDIDETGHLKIRMGVYYTWTTRK